MNPIPLKMHLPAASDGVSTHFYLPPCGRTDIGEQGGFFKLRGKRRGMIKFNLGRVALASFILLCPRFTAWLSAQSPPAEAPTRMSLLDDERRIQVGNRLSYLVEEDRERPIVILVNPQGAVEIPLIGKVEAKGKTCLKLAQEIKSLIEVDFYYRATVLVEFPQYAENLGEVILLGEVRRPGSQQIPVDEILTVSAAVLGAGGFTGDADAEKVTLIRGDPQAGSWLSKNIVRIDSQLPACRSPAILIQLGCLCPHYGDRSGLPGKWNGLRRPQPGIL